MHQTDRAEVSAAFAPSEECEAPEKTEPHNQAKCNLFASANFSFNSCYDSFMPAMVSTLPSFAFSAFAFYFILICHSDCWNVQSTMKIEVQEERIKKFFTVWNSTSCSSRAGCYEPLSRQISGFIRCDSLRIPPYQLHQPVSHEKNFIHSPKTFFFSLSAQLIFPRRGREQSSMMERLSLDASSRKVRYQHNHLSLVSTLSLFNQGSSSLRNSRNRITFSHSSESFPSFAQ